MHQTPWIRLSHAVHLIKNDGIMRLLVGADLNEKDVNAIQKGHELVEILRDKFLSYLDDPEELAKARHTSGWEH